MPEIYPSWVSLISAKGGGAPPVHVAFKPFDEIRLLKGAINVAHVAWEFSVLPRFARLPAGHYKQANIFNDYVHTLDGLDEIWVGCDYTRQIFAREGLTRVAVIPAPIKVPDRLFKVDTPRLGEESSQPALVQMECSADQIRRASGDAPLPVRPSGLHLRIASCRSREGKVFVAVLNPGDRRKNLAALMLGFQKHCERAGADDLLLIKLVLDGHVNTIQSAVRHQLPERFSEVCCSFEQIDCKNIVLLDGRLSEAEMSWIFRSADFYLCTSSAEGQNLPILEAMAHGVVPISPAVTAMADYVSEENGIVLGACEAPVHARTSEDYGLVGAKWFMVSTAEVAKGLRRAVDLPREQIASMRVKAAETIVQRYAPAPVMEKVRERLAVLCRQVGSARTAAVAGSY